MEFSSTPKIKLYFLASMLDAIGEFQYHDPTTARRTRTAREDTPENRKARADETRTRVTARQQRRYQQSLKARQQSETRRKAA